MVDTNYDIPFLYRNFLLTQEQCIEITHEFFDNSYYHVFVDDEAKTSTDLPALFSRRNTLLRYSKSVNYIWDALGIAFEEYADRYESFKILHQGWKLNDDFNFQFYLPGQGFSKWHCENVPSRDRLLVWTIYLSNCEDGGTEYKEFNHTEKCEMGKVVISPADWAYSHRSQISHTKHKFIATGWVSIMPNMKQ